MRTANLENQCFSTKRVRLGQNTNESSTTPIIM